MHRFLATIATTVLLLTGSEALGQCTNNPEGTPLGCADRSGQGQKLDGVASVVFANVDQVTFIASSAEVIVRLTEGKEPAAFFAVVAEPIDTSNFEAVRNTLVAALEDQVKERFFAEACANDGCPEVFAIVRCFDNFAVTDNGVDQFIVADIVIQMSERL